MSKSKKITTKQKKRSAARAAHQRRRKKNNAGVPKQDALFPMIDGNLTYYPYAYCNRKHGYLTKSLCAVHQCIERNCPRCLIFNEEPNAE